MCGLSRAAPVVGRANQPQLQILWKFAEDSERLKSSAGLAGAEINPEPTALVGGVPPALRAAGGASCLLWEAIMANIFSQESGSNDTCHVCTFCLRSA